MSYSALANGAKYLCPNGSTNIIDDSFDKIQNVCETISEFELESAKEAWSNGLSSLPEARKETYPM